MIIKKSFVVVNFLFLLCFSSNVFSTIAYDSGPDLLNPDLIAMPNLITMKDEKAFKNFRIILSLQGEPNFVGSNIENNGKSIFQLKVRTQGSSHCGYHALKNIMILYDWVEKQAGGDIKSAKDLATSLKDTYKELQKDKGLQSNSVFKSHAFYKILKDSVCIGAGYSLVKDLFKPTPDQMLPSYVSAILKDSKFSKYEGAFLASGGWRENFFSSPIGPADSIDILSVSRVLKINKAFTDITSGKKKFLGIVFSKDPRHWIAVAFVPIKLKNSNKIKLLTFCFDSWNNNNQIKHATITFLSEISEISEISEENSFLKKYITFVLGASFLKKLKDLGDVGQDKKKFKKLHTFMTSKGGPESFLGLLSCLDLPENKILKKAVESFFELSENKKYLSDLYSAITKLFDVYLSDKCFSVRKKLSIYSFGISSAYDDETLKIIIDVILKDYLFNDLKKIQNFLEDQSPKEKQLSKEERLLIQLKEKLIGLKESLDLLKNRLQDLSKNLKELKQKLSNIKVS